MKKILCMTAFVIMSVVYGQEIGEKAYKEVRAGGSEVSRWLCCTKITEFDAKENIIHLKAANSGVWWIGTTAKEIRFTKKILTAKNACTSTMKTDITFMTSIFRTAI